MSKGGHWLRDEKMIFLFVRRVAISIGRHDGKGRR